MRIKGTPAELEARRRRAAVLLGQGKGVNEVARLVGASSSSVSRWKTALRKRGPEGLKSRPHPGRRPRLSKADKRRLVSLLKRGALAAGYPNDLWTCRRVTDLIGKTFNVWYDLNHVGRILHSMGLSVQKPEARARERDEAAIERWRKQAWPRIKKTRAG
ncbi:MAG: IS630 family transposase [Phycisphaerales bacterium]|nr:IS630 family transposase [Phycisphaerales bacterium]